LAESIKNRFQIDAELIEGRGGVFEVEVNGKLVFSKKKLNRFPTDEEIFSSIESIA